MILFPPTEKPVHVSLTSGHAVLIQVDGTDVEDMFIKDAFAKGCVHKALKETPKDAGELTEEQMLAAANLKKPKV